MGHSFVQLDQFLPVETTFVDLCKYSEAAKKESTGMPRSGVNYNSEQQAAKARLPPVKPRLMAEVVCSSSSANRAKALASLGRSGALHLQLATSFSHDAGLVGPKDPARILMHASLLPSHAKHSPPLTPPEKQGASTSARPSSPTASV